MPAFVEVCGYGSHSEPYGVGHHRGAAQHGTELPVTGRTSVRVLGAVRGVGGIDSWGTDVEEPYHVSGEEDHSVSFRIVLQAD